MGYLTAFCGKNPTGNIDPELVPLVFQHLPAGTSVNVMAHWAQVRSNALRYCMEDKNGCITCASHSIWCASCCCCHLDKPVEYADAEVYVGMHMLITQTYFNKHAVDVAPKHLVADTLLLLAAFCRESAAAARSTYIALTMVQIAAAASCRRATAADDATWRCMVSIIHLYMTWRRSPHPLRCLQVRL